MTERVLILTAIGIGAAVAILAMYFMVQDVRKSRSFSRRSWSALITAGIFMAIGIAIALA
jgi:dolichyl-phosphate-mannose--protein O-mannosyl transferase